jgi:3-oxoacyl-[acyl-carrier-protein] synthase-1
MVQSRPDSGSSSPVKLNGLGFALAGYRFERRTAVSWARLTDASMAALSEAGIQMHQIGFRLSDVTGESYGFKELSLVVGRLLRIHRQEGYPIWHCAENIGDTGAAAGVVQLIRAFHAFQKGYAPGTIAMCFTSSDWGQRAVAMLASNSVGIAD